MLNALTKREGFRDKNHVEYDLFGKSNRANDILTLEELGLRFADKYLLSDRSGSKWEDTKTREDAWKKTRKELNFFRKKGPQKELELGVRRAIQDAVGKMNNLDTFDAEYAENLAFTKVRWVGSAAYNDTTVTGWDAWTKTQRVMDYRLNQLHGRKNGYGDLQNIMGIKRLSLTFWEGIFGNEVLNDETGAQQKRNLLGIMQTGFIGDSNAKLRDFDVDRRDEETFGSNHIQNGFKMYKQILYEHAIPFEKMISRDAFGRVTVDRQEMDKVMNDWLKNLRYTYDQIGLNYNEQLDDAYIEWVQDDEGAYAAEFRFKKQRLKDVFFHKDIINMGMYNRREYIKYWEGKQYGKRDENDEDMLIQYTRNVLAYLIAKEMLEHRLIGGKNSNYNLSYWGFDEIRAIESMFENYAGGNAKETTAKKFGLFGKRYFDAYEMKKIRQIGNALYPKMLWDEARWQIVMGFIAVSGESVKRGLPAFKGSLWG